MDSIEDLVEEAFAYFEGAGIFPDHDEIVDYVAEAFQTQFGAPLDSVDFFTLESCIQRRINA